LTRTESTVGRGQVAPELEKIFEQHYQFVYRTAYSLTGSPHDAEDITQTIFMRLLARESPPDLTRSLEPYLYRAAFNLSLNRIELAPLAFELVARSRRSNDDIAPLRGLVAQSKTAATSGYFACFFENHLVLFKKVWELSGNKFLQQTLERLVVPLFVLYLTRVSFMCVSSTQKAIACSDHQEQILQTLLNGEVSEASRIASNCLVQMKAMIESNGTSHKMCLHNVVQSLDH
jgi:RNA polymerase sigma factor (sigma-70 family)